MNYIEQKSFLLNKIKDEVDCIIYSFSKNDLPLSTIVSDSFERLTRIQTYITIIESLTLLEEIE